MKKVYISSDGDGIGSQVGRAGLNDDVEGMRRISQAIKQGNGLVVSFVIEHGGEMILEGGDETSFSINADKLCLLSDLREKWRKAVGATLSMGVGHRLSQAGMALMASKIRGKDQITLWTPEVEEEVKRAMAGPPQSAEDKLREEYFDDYEKSEKLEKELKLLEHITKGDGEKQSVKDRLKATIQEQQEDYSENESEEISGEDEEGIEDQGGTMEESGSGAQEIDKENGSQVPPTPEEEVNQQGKEETREIMRQMLGEALLQFKENADAVEQMKEKNPEAYQAVYDLVGAVTQMTSELLGDEEENQEEVLQDE